MPVALNEKVVKGLPVPNPDQRDAVHWFRGAMIEGKSVPAGFGVVVTKKGERSFILVYRVGQQQRWMTIGRYPDWKPLKAVNEARTLRQRIDRGEDPLAERKAIKAAKPEPEPAEKTVASVIDDFLRVYVGKRLRQPRNYRQPLERLVVPAIGALPIYSLRRSHIASMLNRIEDKNGPVMADRILAYLSSCLNWWSSQDDDFAAPRLKGLKRAPARSRDRVLSDDEVRVLWQAAEANGTFGALVRFLLLTGQRRGEVERMTWDELDIGKGDWTIPAERYKTGRTHHVPLSSAALAILKAQARTGALVFPGHGGAPMTRGNNRKDALARAMTKLNGAPLKPWTLHDLRRTARTLMARAGVRPDIAERVVGHVVGGEVERVYDRHVYESEKRNALEVLARLIEQILNPSPPNVVPFRQEVAG